MISYVMKAKKRANFNIQEMKYRFRKYKKH